jgi:hypothetical protein
VPQRSLKDLLGMGKTPVVYDYLGNGMPSRFAALADTASGFFVSIVAPTLLFRDLDVKKPRNSHSKPPIVSRPH